MFGHRPSSKSIRQKTKAKTKVTHEIDWDLIPSTSVKRETHKNRKSREKNKPPPSPLVGSSERPKRVIYRQRLYAHGVTELPTGFYFFSEQRSRRYPEKE